MNNTSKWIVGIIVVLLVVWGGYSYFQNPSSNEPIKIGVILPLTGDLSSLGEPAKTAIGIAVDEINAEGGIRDRKLEVIYEDSKCTGATAASAVQKLVNIDGVSVIIGDICSSVTLAAAPIVEKGKVSLISPCSSNPDITSASDYVFRVYPSDAFQGKFSADYLKNKLNYSKAAILFVQNDWGFALDRVFKENFTAMGGNIVAEESYLQTARDLRTQLSKIKEANPEVIYFAGYTDDSIAGLKQIKELGIKSVIWGADSWADPKTASGAGSFAEGIMWVAVETATVPQTLQEKMEAATGNKDVPVCSTQSYDIVKLIEKALSGLSNFSGENIKNSLYKTTLNGISGDIAFDENGDLKDINYDVYTVKDGKTTVVEK